MLHFSFWHNGHTCRDTQYNKTIDTIFNIYDKDTRLCACVCVCVYASSVQFVTYANSQSIKTILIYSFDDDIQSFKITVLKFIND